MLTVHTEITIEVGDFSDPPITLWLVSYGPATAQNVPQDLPKVLTVLRRACAKQGWLLECEHDDSYRNRNPNLFSQGFLWPDGDDLEA